MEEMLVLSMSGVVSESTSTISGCNIWVSGASRPGIRGPVWNKFGHTSLGGKTGMFWKKPWATAVGEWVTMGMLKLLGRYRILELIGCSSTWVGLGLSKFKKMHAAILGFVEETWDRRSRDNGRTNKLLMRQEATHAVGLGNV